MRTMNNEKKLELIKKVQDYNNEEALEELIFIYKNMVYKIAHKYKFNKIELEDLVQDGYLALIEAIHEYEISNADKLDIYIYTVIKHKIINKSLYEHYLNYTDNEILKNLSYLDENLDSIKPMLFKYMNEVLTKKEALILRWRFGLDEEKNWLTTKEISKIARIGERRINFIINSSLIKLKEPIAQALIQKK